MKVNIVVNPVFDGWSPWDTRLGGTEESVVEWATALKRRGHDVSVFHNGTHGRFQMVDYRDRADYPGFAGEGITLNCNYPDLPVYEPTVYFNNLVDAAKYNLEAFRAIVHPSNWARDNLQLRHRNQEVVPHGYDPTQIYPDEKVPRTVLYASSPDRGLQELAQVWPEVVQSVPDAQLIVTYNGSLDNLPNCICLGDVDAITMAELYRSSDIWCHPALGGELFGIAGVKAQVAGCWPVYYPIMALQETVQYGTKTDRAHLASDLIEALTGHPDAPPPSPQRHYVDWEESTDLLEQVLLKYR